MQFHLLIESEEKAYTPGDVMAMLKRVIEEVRGCKTDGNVVNEAGESVGEWALELEE